MDLTRLTVRRSRRAAPAAAASTAVADPSLPSRVATATDHRVAWPGTGGPAPLRLTLPAGLHRLPLPARPGVTAPIDRAAAQDAACGGVDGLVRALFPWADEPWRTRLTDHYRAVAGVYAERGLRFAAIGFFAAPPGSADRRPAPAAFTVAAVRSAHTSTAAAVCTLAEGVHRAGGSDVEPVLLPCGPAVSVAHCDPAESATRPGGRRLPTAHFQLRVPSPSTPWTYILDMATTSSAHWARVATLAADIAHSVVLG